VVLLSPDFESSGLTLVGVGPGDPSLLTLGAVSAIQSATVVAYPVSKAGEAGMAATIAKKWISSEKRRLPLLFPMLTDGLVLKNAWINAADQLAKAVYEGEKVVFLSQGDVSLYATSSYVLFEMKDRHPDCPVRLLPGVNSISAAAAVGQWPLALQHGQLLVLPTPNDPLELETILLEESRQNRMIALVKLGNRWSWVKQLLRKHGFLDKSLFAQRVGLLDQKVQLASEISDSDKPYFSLLLIPKIYKNTFT